MSAQFPIFNGNCPKNVSRDAKYSVRTYKGNMVVGLLYETPNDERWHMSNGKHERLVAMVNAVKTSVGGQPGGPFYINEHAQVIVPAGPDSRYYLAGEYEDPIRFPFEGHVIGGDGLDMNGRPLEPGDIWSGPHPGIPYVLKAGGGDIYYVSQLREDVTRKVVLSKQRGLAAAKAMADRIQAVKGWAGGRFYVNEWREIFAPLNAPDGLTYRYIGHLELDDPWFDKVD
jgi:hypothetical protein